MIHQTDLRNTLYYNHHQQTQPNRRRSMKPAHKSFIIWHVLAAFYYICSSYCEGFSSGTNRQLIDLSHTFDNTTIYWVTTRPLTMNVTFNGTMPGKDFWRQAEEISAGTHGGTHLDAPCHFAYGTWCVSDIPLHHLVVPAVVIDFSTRVKGNPDIHLGKDDLVAWERKYGQIPDGCLVLVYTGWSQYWPDPLKYSGTVEKNASLLKFPSIKPEVAKWLISNRNIVGIGIDTMSIDVPNVVETHVTLMKKNIYGLENVNNLDLLPPTGAAVYVMPMKLKDASGAPCRLLAEIPATGNGAIRRICSTSLIAVVIALCFAFLKVNERERW